VSRRERPLGQTVEVEESEGSLAHRAQHPIGAQGAQGGGRVGRLEYRAVAWYHEPGDEGRQGRFRLTLVQVRPQVQTPRVLLARIENRQGGASITLVDGGR